MTHSWRLVPAFALISSVLVIPLAACSFDNNRVSGRIHQSVAMPDGGSLVVSEGAGTIRIEAWDKPLVTVDATAYASDTTALRQIRIDVTRTPEGVAVSSAYTGSGLLSRSGDVNLVIHAPASANLELSSSAGVITVRGSRASVKARTSAGQIDVRMALVEGVQQIALRATTGQITLSIPRSSSATVDASAMIGSSTNEFHTSTIGTGAAAISMHAITGEVELKARD
jgi:hypothetical protein